MDFSISYRILLSIITSFTITYSAIPSIIRVVELRNFFDSPNERKLHTQNIPTLGGTAIFAGVSISSIIFNYTGECANFMYIIAACIVLFFIGLKDDILLIAARKKFGGQLVAAFITVVLGNLRISSLHGILGIFQLPYWMSTFLSILVIVTLINAYNFIDGLDGLASSLGMLSTLLFGSWFLVNGSYSFAIISFSLLGALAAFFRFNVFGGKQKIFMGDTGSMLIGYILAASLIYFVEANKDTHAAHTFISAPVIALGVVIVPFFDLLRVTFIRAFVTHSLSSADKNHIHHRLIRLGLSHIKATLILTFVNFAFVVFLVYFRQIGTLRLILLSFIFAMVLSYVPTLLMFRKIKKLKDRKS